jgi:hypothetical protein
MRMQSVVWILSNRPAFPGSGVSRTSECDVPQLLVSALPLYPNPGAMSQFGRQALRPQRVRCSHLDDRQLSVGRKILRPARYPAFQHVRGVEIGSGSMIQASYHAPRWCSLSKK